MHFDAGTGLYTLECKRGAKRVVSKTKIAPRKSFWNFFDVNLTFFIILIFFDASGIFVLNLPNLFLDVFRTFF